MMKKIFLGLLLIISFVFMICLMPFKVLATEQETLLADLENGVSIVGTFNNYDETSNPMQKERDNVWSIELDSVYSATADNNFVVVTKSKNYKWNGDTTTNFGTYALELNGSDDLVFDAALASKKIKVIFNMSNYDYTTDTGATITILDYELTEVSDETTLLDAITNKKANIKMMNDINITSGLSIDYITYLDLNGKILNYDNTNAFGSVIKVTTDGDLTINDSDKTTSTFFNADNPLWVKYVDGQTCNNKVEVLGGCITGGTGYYTSKVGDCSYGGGIYNDGIVNFNSGNIIGCQVKGKGTGSNKIMQGGGVYNNGTFYMNGGSIQGCYGESALAGDGTAVYNQNKFIMNAGLIDGCNIDVALAFSALIYNNKDFTISGNSKITNNYSNLTATIYNYKGIIYANGGTIDVDVEIFEGKIDSDNSTITKNDMTVFNSDIYNEYGTINTGVFNGEILNTGGTIKGCFKVEFIIETGYMDINIDSYLLAGENILISSPEGMSLDWYQNSDFEGEPWDFANDKVNSNLTLYGKTIEKLVSTEKELNEAAKIDYAHIILKNDIILNDSFVLLNATPITIFLDLNGNVLKYENDNKQCPVITNYYNSNLYIIDSNPNKEHKFDTTNDVWVLVSDDAKGDNIETIKGGIITGGTGLDFMTDSYFENGVIIPVIEKVGGGIYSSENLYILGGTIVGCYSKSAVSAFKNFVIQNATIIGCEGYGIGYSQNNIIIENNANINNGIYASSGAKIYANGGVVYGNIKTKGVVSITSSTNSSNATYFYGEVEANTGLTLSAGVYFNKINDVKYGANDYLVSFISDNLCIKEIKVIGNTIIDEIEMPTKDGFVFKGWYTTDNQIYDFSNIVSSDLYLIAKWEIDETKINQLIDDLEKAKNELQNAIDTKVDSTEYEVKIKELNDAIKALENVKDNYVSADEELKQTLEDEITEAKNTLQTVIDNLTLALNEAKSELQAAIDTKVDSTEYEVKIKELNDAIKALENVKDNYVSADEELKQTLEDEITEAKNTLQTVIDNLTLALNEAKSELQAAIDTKVDSTEYEVKIKELNDAIKALENVKDNYVSADEELKQTLEDEITEAKNTLQTAINQLTQDLEKIKDELNKAIDTKANTTEVITKLNSLQSQINVLDNIKDNYVTADEILKQTLGDEIAGAKNTLQTVIDKLSLALNTTKSELEAAINAGDTDLSSKISNLNEALSTMEKALKAVDTANKEELTNDINEVKELLNEAVNTLSNRLQNTENKVEQLNNKITTIIIIFSAIIVLINGGMIAWALVWKKRKGL